MTTQGSRSTAVRTIYGSITSLETIETIAVRIIHGSNTWAVVFIRTQRVFFFFYLEGWLFGIRLFGRIGPKRLSAVPWVSSLFTSEVKRYCEGCGDIDKWAVILVTGPDQNAMLRTTIQIMMADAILWTELIAFQLLIVYIVIWGLRLRVSVYVGVRES